MARPAGRPARGARRHRSGGPAGPARQRRRPVGTAATGRGRGRRPGRRRARRADLGLDRGPARRPAHRRGAARLRRRDRRPARRAGALAADPARAPRRRDPGAAPVAARGHRPAWSARADAGFTPAGFAAARRPPRRRDRRYVSLVPTQLHRLLRRPAAGLDALLRLDAVLVGGAATPARAARARPRRRAPASSPPTACPRRAAAASTTASRWTACDVALDAGRRHPARRAGRWPAATATVPDLDAAAFVERGGAPLAAHRATLGRLDDGRPDRRSAAPTTSRHRRGQGRAGRRRAGGRRAWTASARSASSACPTTSGARPWSPSSSRGRALRPRPPRRCAPHVATTLGAPAAPRHVVLVDRLPLRGPGKVDRRAGGRARPPDRLGRTAAQLIGAPWPPPPSGSPARVPAPCPPPPRPSSSAPARPRSRGPRRPRPRAGAAGARGRRSRSRSASTTPTTTPTASAARTSTGSARCG